MFWPHLHFLQNLGWINIKQLMDFEIALQFLSLDASILLHFKDIASLLGEKRSHKIVPVPSANK